MANTTVTARHRSDVTTTDALRTAIRRLRARKPVVSKPQHRGGTRPAVGASFMGIAVLAVVAASVL